MFKSLKQLLWRIWYISYLDTVYAHTWSYVYRLWLGHYSRGLRNVTKSLSMFRLGNHTPGWIKESFHVKRPSGLRFALFSYNSLWVIRNSCTRWVPRSVVTNRGLSLLTIDILEYREKILEMSLNYPWILSSEFRGHPGRSAHKLPANWAEWHGMTHKANLEEAKNLKW